MVCLLVHLRTVVGGLLSALGVQHCCVTVWGHVETTGMLLPRLEASYLHVSRGVYIYADTPPFRRLVI